MGGDALISYGTTNGKCHRDVQEAVPRREPPHGTVKRYMKGCRCRKCREARYATKTDVERGVR